MRHRDCALRTAWALLVLVTLTVGTNQRSVTAGSISYSNVNAPDVIFSNITESNGVPAAPAVPLFGPPSRPAIGNTLDFDPLGFRAEAGPQEGVLVDGQLNFFVMSRHGFPIRSLIFQEHGQYEVLGQALANVHMSIDSIEVIGISYGGSTVPPPEPVEAGADPYTFSETFFDGPLQQGAWSGELVVDIDQLLADHGIDAVATKVKIALDNRLTAAALRRGASLIDKKDFSVRAVPEPSAIVLLSLGMLGIAGLAWRRRTVSTGGA